jgi:hypothetical protein
MVVKPTARRRRSPRLALAAAVLAALGCRPAAVATPLPATAAGVPAPPGRAPAGLPMPSLAVEWAPAVVSAGDVEALAGALQRYRRVELQLGPRLGRHADRLRRAIDALSPTTELEAHASAPGSARPAEPLPVLRTGDAPGARPRYSAQGVAIDLPAGGPADPVLVLDVAAVDPDTWHRQPASTVGSCEAALAAVGAGQEQSLAELEPFLDHVDATLELRYREAVALRLPVVRSELERRAKAPAGDDETARCVASQRAFLDELAPCATAEGTCAAAPRVYLLDLARIGSAEPPIGIGEECAVRLGTDPATAMRGVARDVVRQAAEEVDAGWSALAARLAALGELRAALDDACAPRRRRFAAADLEEARRRLAAFGDAYRRPEAPRPGAARWVVSDADFHVAGIGHVQQLARFDGGPGSVAGELVERARELRELILGRARCRPGGEQLPLAALLVDRRRAQVEFLGFYYREELACDDLPPLIDAG